MLRIYNEGMNPPPSFNRVYQAALLQSAVHLTQYLNQEIASVDVKAGGKYGLITPAGLLALHAKDDAVKFLSEHHADVDYIGYGAALANRVEQAEYWRTVHGAHPDLLARGAAYAGNMNYALKLQQSCGANIIEIGVGLILGGHSTLFKNWYKQDNNVLSDNMLQQLAIAAGISGNTPVELIDIFTERTNIIAAALTTGAAIAGRSNFNESRFKMPPGLEEGLIAGGHLELLPADSYDSMDAAKFAWSGSNVDFLQTFIERRSSKNKPNYFSMMLTAEYIADSGDIDLIKHVVKSHPEISLFLVPRFHRAAHTLRNFRLLAFLCQQNPLINEKLKEYVLAGQFKIPKALALPQLVFNRDFLLQMLLSELSIETKETYTLWIKQADGLRKLMLRYDLNLVQAMAIMNSPDLRIFLLRVAKDVNSLLLEIPLDMKAKVITFLSDLSAADAKDLLLKVRHYNFVVADLWQAAEALQEYAFNDNAKLKDRAMSLSADLFAVRQHKAAVNILSNETGFVLDIEMQNGVFGVELAKSKAGLFAPCAKQLAAMQNKAHAKPIEHFDETYNNLVSTHFNKLAHKMLASDAAIVSPAGDENSLNHILN